DLFLVGGQAVEDRVERAGRLAGGDQVAVKSVEVVPVLAKRLRHRRARLDLVLDLHHEARETGVAMAAGDDLERLQKRYARLQHRRELPREERNVLFADLAGAA